LLKTYNLTTVGWMCVGDKCYNSFKAKQSNNDNIAVQYLTSRYQHNTIISEVVLFFIEFQKWFINLVSASRM